VIGEVERVVLWHHDEVIVILRRDLCFGNL
jgi:hypothetical protein